VSLFVVVQGVFVVEEEEETVELKKEKRARNFVQSRSRVERVS